MSYNIHQGEGMDGKIGIERIGKLIIDTHPEVVGLQSDHFLLEIITATAG